MYSSKYCERLVNIRTSFRNTECQDTIRQCLQTNLHDKLKPFNTTTNICDSIKQIDLESHVSCLSKCFHRLEAIDIENFISIFNDTTINYAQLCKLSENVRGHFNVHVLNGNVADFIKKQLQKVFPEGDILKCTIKEKEIQESATDIKLIKKILGQVNKIKGNINLVTEKNKTIGNDFKTIRDIVKEIENDPTEIRSGLKNILEKSNTISTNLIMIVETIESLDNETDLSTLMAQFNMVTESGHDLRFILISINSIIKNIGNGVKSIEEGLSSLLIVREINNNTMTGKETKQLKTENKSLKKSHSWFDWIQLIATISVSIAIAIYTIYQDKSQTRIAIENRQKDHEIAQENRVQDLEIALDQQRENTLNEYIDFLTNILIMDKTDVNMNAKDKHAAWFRTLTAMKRLDAERKSFLLKVLYSANLIKKQSPDDPDGDGVLSFREVDLSGITLGSTYDSTVSHCEEHRVDLTYLSLAYADLTNASFRHTILGDVNFMASDMNWTDFSRTVIFHRAGSCRFNRIIFIRAFLSNAIFFGAEFYGADFQWAILINANLTYFKCSLCTFADARLDHAYIDQAYFKKYADCTTDYSSFSRAHMNGSFLQAVHFVQVDFTSTFLTNIRGMNVFFNQSIFHHALLTNSSFRYSTIVNSNFNDADLSYSDLSDSQMTNVSFIRAKLQGTNMSNIMMGVGVGVGVGGDTVRCNLTHTLNMLFDVVKPKSVVSISKD
ncbi:hypothetical protein I4U23_022069 [Adineta vaga]|nr:hypothetical protein I4U23_022069 [Adineta vaga]